MWSRDQVAREFKCRQAACLLHPSPSWINIDSLVRTKEDTTGCLSSSSTVLFSRSLPKSLHYDMEREREREGKSRIHHRHHPESMSFTRRATRSLSLSARVTRELKKEKERNSVQRAVESRKTTTFRAGSTAPPT